MQSVSPSHANADPPLEVRGGLGVGAMISPNQRAQGYGSSFMVEARPAWRFADSVAAELSFSSWIFPVRDTSGRATLLGAGARFDPRLTRQFSLFIDAHAGLGMTGPNNRLMFDGAAGLEYAFNEFIALGPFVRYGQVLDSGMDAKFAAGGMYVSLLWPPEQAPPTPAPASVATRPRPAEPPPLAPAPPRLTDSDNDGVADRQDACPSEPRGPNPDPQRTGCPDGDDDKDGVPNGVDRCRQQAFGANPDPVAMGCPLADRDRDMVPDLYDRCPDTAGAPDPEAPKNGCPGLVQIARGEIKISQPVLFAPGKDVISKSSLPILKAVASALKASPGIKKVSIEGHTATTQDAPEQSLQLSQSRAESVRLWLSQNGVEADRLEIKGFGDTRPLASNKTAKGRAQNQRIELMIVDPAPESP